MKLRALKLAGSGIGLVVAVMAPLFLESYRVNQLTHILIVAIAVMGLNLLTGFTGQVSVGHSVFFGMGAYVTAILVVDTNMNHGLSIAIGAASGFVLGAIVGIPGLRIKGVPLAIVTLVLAAAFPPIVRRFESLTGGSQGLRVRKFGRIDGFFLAEDQVHYLVVLVVMLVIALLIFILRGRPLGRAIRAVGDHETAAVSFGARPGILRVGVFAGSAAIAALAGGLFVSTAGFIAATTSYITILGAVQFLAALVIGGRAILWGPLIGAAVTELIPMEVGELSPELAHLVYGLILIGLLLLAPGGISDLVFGRWKRVGKQRVLPASNPLEKTNVNPAREERVNEPQS